MIILVGASASGKTEIKKSLIKNYHYEQSITSTTRAMRTNEKDGIDYHFFSKETFLKLLENDMFVETTIYQSHFYGTQKKDLKTNAVIVLDPHGANKLRNNEQYKPFVVYIDASKEIRKKRMLKRNDNLKSIEERLLSDDLTFQQSVFEHIDLHIVNEEHQLDEIVKLIHQQYQLHVQKYI